MTNQLIFKSGCWTCKRAREDPQEEYICPKAKQHWQEMMSLTEKALFEL